MTTIRPLAAALLATGAFLTTTPVRAQGADPAAARAALAECRAAAEGRQEAQAKAAADRAEPLYRAWMAAAPRQVEPRVGLAQVKSRCRLPFADLMGQGALIGQANALLDEALSVDSTHWEARFTLAMHHFHTPEFLGRTPDAVRELETLLRQQGGRAEPHFAETYVYLGDLYRRTGREAEARALWERGARLFPGDARFGERLGTTNGGAAAAAPSAIPNARPPGRVAAASDSTRSLSLAPMTADGGSRLDDPRGAVSLRRVDVLTTPGGAADVLQAFQTMPGTTRAGEGSDLYVRGGDPAEAPVFVDGARLFHPGRYEGLNGSVFGILDANVIRSAYFASGGFSARYGDALSGVLDLETRGRPDARTARLSANTVQVGLGADLPLGPDAGAWATLRASDSRLLLALHGRGGEFARAPGAIEGMIGAVWQPRAGTEVRLTALADGDHSARSVDAYGWSGPFHTRGMNRLAALSARAVSADGARSVRASLSASLRETALAFGVLDRERRDRGVTGRVEGDLALGAGRVRWGAEAAWLDARQEGTVPTTDRLAPGAPSEGVDADPASTSHVGGYVEAEREIGSGIAVVAGLRADRLPGEDAWTADPRLALAVRAGGGWTLRLAGGVFHQGRWRTRYRLPDEGSPSGTPTEARHLVAGAERGGEPSLKVEAFVKAYGDYVASGEGPRITGGRAAGLDAVVRWDEQTRVNGWITYSYLDGRVELEDGSTAPSAVDVRHALTAVSRITVAPRWEVGLTGRWATGKPFTAIGGASADGRPVYGAPHGARMPPYTRLDGRITRYLPGRAGVGVVYLEMLNLLDRVNVQAYTYEAGYARRRALESFFSHRTLVLGMGLSL